MASITFTGDPKAPGTDPAKLVMMGHTFPLNRAVEIDDPKIIKKLSSHSHFSVQNADAELKRAAKSDNLAKARAAKAKKSAM